MNKRIVSLLLLVFVIAQSIPALAQSNATPVGDPPIPLPISIRIVDDHGQAAPAGIQVCISSSVTPDETDACERYDGVAIKRNAIFGEQLTIKVAPGSEAFSHSKPWSL